MPTSSYRKLHEQVIGRPGAAERLAELREETLAEVGLYELRKVVDQSQVQMAAMLEISQSAVSQLERAHDIKLSTLRSYLEKLGARLALVAVFEEGGKEVEIPIRVGA